MPSAGLMKTWSDVRVGLLTFAALLLLVLGITFAGGDKGLFLQKTSFLKAHLADVGGLKKGSSVTMGGMTIGRVTDIHFVANPEELIEVDFQVRSDIRGRIKADSICSVRTQGMLGDRYLDVSLGSKKAGPLPESAVLGGNPATDFDATLRQASDVLGETEKVLTAVNEKQGTVGQFFYDGEFYRELTDLIKDFKKHPRKYIKFSLF